MTCFSLSPFCTLQIQCQKPFQNRFVGKVGGPAVGGGDGGIKPGVAVGQPGRTGVVELGQGALLQAGGAGGVTRDETGVADGAD